MGTLAAEVNWQLPARFHGDLVVKAVWGILTRRRLPECWDSTRSIAERIGRGVRTVQLALKRLRAAGLIAVHQVRSRTGPGSASGHRIILRETTPELPDLGAIRCADSAQPVAPRSEVPPDPPIDVPEGEPTEVGSDGDAPPPPQPPVSVPAQKPGPGPDPDPAEPARVLAKAREVLGSEAPAAAQARRFGWAWLDAALDRCAATRARDGAVGVGYLVRVLAGFREEGGPAPAARPRPRPAPPATFQSPRWKAAGRG